MDVPETDQGIDGFLFGGGLTIDDYIMEGDVISYRSANGREFDLLIDHEGLAAACCARLIALGVKRLP